MYLNEDAISSNETVLNVSCQCFNDLSKNVDKFYGDGMICYNDFGKIFPNLKHLRLQTIRVAQNKSGIKLDALADEFDESMKALSPEITANAQKTLYDCLVEKVNIVIDAINEKYNEMNRIYSIKLDWETLRAKLCNSTQKSTDENLLQIEASWK